MSNAFLYRMPAGIPGAISRDAAQAIVEPNFFAASGAPTSYGVPVAISSTDGGVRAITTSDTASSVYGFLVRPFPIQGATNDPLGTSTPPTSGPCDVLKFGYLSVKLNGGATVAKGGAVYVRVASGTAPKPLGGVEGAADSTNTVAVSNAYFTGAADSNGNAEIAFGL